jgi:hypothetical protein
MSDDDDNSTNLQFEEDEEELITPADPIPDLTVYQIPPEANLPGLNQFMYLNWGDPWSNWNIIRFAIPPDGSCLFHAIAAAFFRPYHAQELHDQSISRNDLIIAMRRDLADNLPQYYPRLNSGQMFVFAESVPEFRLEHMQAQLNSHEHIGYGYLEYISLALNKDIYILDDTQHDIYRSDEQPLSATGQRDSIVLYYRPGQTPSDNHYELVSIINYYGAYETHFNPQHSFIQFLRTRMTSNVFK